MPAVKIQVLSSLKVMLQVPSLMLSLARYLSTLASICEAIASLPRVAKAFSLSKTKAEPLKFHVPMSVCWLTVVKELRIEPKSPDTT